ncbi:uncharacterized protein N7506_009625 [Penicillium brevicompactum]|uniref:uncharacterized protein n=1 Tax=Penicillium brevicompactum TaxID=5074 RepID=UPI0025403BC1|nr:uncharacterized protein N7506_009625 [Penicillium brevicompactum]KAJ5326523.1 hypothetical protein N7506_009625 [Penicillium brevicompactum]
MIEEEDPPRVSGQRQAAPPRNPRRRLPRFLSRPPGEPRGEKAPAPGHNVENCYRLQAMAAYHSAAARSLFPAPSKGKTHRSSRGKGKGEGPHPADLLPPVGPSGGSRGEKASVPLNLPGTCLSRQSREDPVPSPPGDIAVALQANNSPGEGKSILLWCNA